MLTLDQAKTLQGKDVIGSDGDKIGSVDALYADREDGHPTFATVNTGLFGMSTNFVPLDQAEFRDDKLYVPYSKDLVKDAPSVDPDAELLPDEEERLYEYYGLTGAAAYTPAFSDGERGGPGHDTSGPNTDTAMTRSEERLEVDKKREQTGKARLRKWVETDTETVQVPVRKERAVLEREPITEGNVDKAMSGKPISEEEHEVVLTEERAKVHKEAVPVERVKLGKEVEADVETVSGDVRKERIEAEGDVYPGDAAKTRESEFGRR